MAMVTKLFRLVRCCGGLSTINTHDISAKWSFEVTWQIKQIAPPADPHHNRQGADLVLESPKHGPLIKGSTWGHVIVWKIYIFIFVRFIANKLGRLLTLGKIFSTHTLMSSPSSCVILFFTCLTFWLHLLIK